MVLQTVIIPERFDEMFLRGGEVKDRAIMIKSGGTVTLDTYYNSFCFSKYKAYTTVASVTCSLRFKGDVSLRLMTEDGTETRCVVQSGGADEISATVDFALLPESGYLYPVISALSDTVVYSCKYSCESESTDISICVGICTYKREQFVLRNLEILREYDFHYIDKVFVSDNGNTLDCVSLSDSFISVLPNKNYGGSGGFTRCLIEAYSNKFSHVILMDDDVEFYPETLEQMTVFIALLKTEFSESWFSAAMLPLDKPWFQFEMGARWNGKSADVFKHDIDIRDKKALAGNLVNPKVQYGGWWALLMPVSVVEKGGLPYPFFIKFDDVEYGMRKDQSTEIITMNGIAIRHEAFDKKTSFVLDYYNLRNELVVNCIYGNLSLRHALKRFWYEVVKQIVLYRYENCKTVFRAVKDFLGGVDFFLKCDEEKLNTELIKNAPKLVPLMEIPEWNESARDVNFVKNNHITPASAITLGGHLIPVFLLKKLAFVPLSRAGAASIFGYKKVLQYQLEGNNGIMTKRSIVGFFRCFFTAVGISFMLMFKFSSAKKSLISRKEQIISLDFWKSHLGI